MRVLARTRARESRSPFSRGLSTRALCGHPSIAAPPPGKGVGAPPCLPPRRFFCCNEACHRKVFTERLPDLIAPYARRTIRLTEALELIGFALGGEAGARALVGLSMTASADTVLRVIRQAALPERETPRVLGVDDFAF